MIKQRIKQFEIFYMSKSPRERVLIFTLSLLIIHTLWSQYFFGFYQKEAEIFQEQSRVLELSVLTYQNELDEIYQMEQRYNFKNVVSQTQELESKIQVLEQEIESLSGSISSPEKTISMLHDLLESQEEVELMSIKNEQPFKNDFISAVIGQDLYQHALILDLQCTYSGLQAFLKKFETLQPSVPLHYLDVQVQDYPLLSVKLTYHMFSSQKEIIRV